METGVEGVEVRGSVCWWCGEPADPESEYTVHLKKEEWLTRKQYRTHRKQVNIPRCQRCAKHQSGDEWKLTLPATFIILLSGGGCYLGYLIQGYTGWMMYAVGIGVFVLLSVLLGIFQYRRVYKSMTEEERKAYEKATDAGRAGEYPVLVKLSEEGWEAGY
jgi:hypothetical protein